MPAACSAALVPCASRNHSQISRTAPNPPARFVTAATRAGQLLVGRGDPDEAERVARRAIAADPWAEAAYGVLVSVALARGDRSAARLALERCLAGHHLPERHTERIEIRTDVRADSGELLGTGKLRCPGKAPRG